MKVLIDTHVFIWWTSDAQKLSLGKLLLKTALPELIEDEVKQNRIELLPINLSHIYALTNLPNHHRYPFDRLLITQAQSEELIMISIDDKFDHYEIKRFW